MLESLPRRRLLRRVRNAALRYLYVVAQPGSGVSTFARDCFADRSSVSYCVMPNVDRLQPEELAEYLRWVKRPEPYRLLVATASDPMFPQPFSEARASELCVLSDEDFAFTHEDIASLFRLNGVELSDHAARTVYAVTGGWAAGVGHALRIWQTEGEDAACNAESRSYHGVRVYLYERVLSSLSPDELAALVTAVAIGDAHADALQSALPACNVEVARASLTQRRLLLRNGAALTFSGLVSASVREHYRGDIRSLSMQIAGDVARTGDYLSAARIAFSAGARETGVSYLLRAPFDEFLAQRAAVHGMIAALPDSVVSAHPKLWFPAVMSRRYRVDLQVLIAEAQALLSAFDGLEDPRIMQLVRSTLHLGLYEAGEFEKAAELEASAEYRARGDGLVEAMLAANASAALSLVGKDDEAARRLRDAAPLLASSPVLRALFMYVHLRKARIAGNWFAEKVFVERGIDAALASGEPTTIAMSLMHGAFGALLAGDRAAMESFLARLRGMSDAPEIAPFVAIGRISREPRTGSEPRFGLPRLRACVHLLHAVYAGSAQEARTQIAAAMEEFDASGYVFGRVLTRVALAQVLPNRQSEFIAEAKTIAGQLESQALNGALSHLAIGELPAYGQPLRRFAEEMRRLREPAAAPLRVSTLLGLVERDGRALDVSQRVFLLLAALSVRRRPLEREELCEMLWPDESPQDAANALKMTVRRARLQCGDAAVVCWRNNKYSLGEHVGVHLDEVRHAGEAAFKKVPGPRERGDLLGLYRMLAGGRPAYLLEHEWFAGTEAMLLSLQIQLGEALARSAIQQGDFAGAPEFAHLMLECDPCDETAWELLIRRHLAAGEREAAARALRDCRRALKVQLQTEPSRRIAELLK